MKNNDASRYNLYFVIRSLITGLIGFLLFSVLAFIFGNLTYVQAIILSFICFVSPAILSKSFPSNLANLSKS